MLRTNYHAPGSAPGSLSPPAVARPPQVTLIEYDRDRFDERQVGDIAEVFPCRDSGKVSWVNIAGLGDVDLLNRLGAHFGMHPLALEDVLNVHQRPKIEEYPDHFFIVTRMAYFDHEDELVFEQVCMFLGRTFLVTIMEDPGDVFEPVRERLRAGRGFARSRGHDYLAYTLLDAVIDHYFPVLESVGESLEQVEDMLIEAPRRECLVELHELKRTLLLLRRSAWPERDLLNALTRDDSGMIRPETRLFLRDCYDHSVRIIEMIEGYRDLSAGLNDLYLSSIGNRTAEIMRVLTVVSTIFIPLTFIAGVYGMNFDHMPELRLPWGYFALLAVMASIAGTMLAFFRRRRWL